MMSPPLQFILFVQDQYKSKVFYQQVLQLDPVLDVSGMTEFQLSSEVKLGLMPVFGIAKILTPKMPDPASAAGVPRCELYLNFSDPESVVQRILSAGGYLISNLQKRDWGDTVAYLSDPDGHILAIKQA
jgi:predicted enzyme related to lactoylglutathione lyase